MADAAQLQMAVGNLLRNAIEALAQQPPEQRRVLVQLQRVGESVDLLIADSGPGFAFDLNGDTLFRSTKAGGTGLGLFVVRTTVSNHHGRMRIGRSHALAGTEVCITLPLARAAGAEKYSAMSMVLSAQASSFVCPASLQPMLHAVVDKIEAYDCLGAEIADLLRVKAPAPLAKLTRRELEVLTGIGAGLTNQQISERMHLSVHTVETHRRNLSGKLGLKGAELIRYATLQSLQAHTGSQQ